LFFITRDNNCIIEIKVFVCLLFQVQITRSTTKFGRWF